MNSNAEKFHAAIERAHGFVSAFLAVKLATFQQVSHNPDRTIDEILKKQQWYADREVPCDSYTWFRAIQSKTLQEIESVMMLHALEKDTKALESKAARWAQGEISQENVLISWGELAQAVRYSATRCGWYLLVHHCSRNGKFEKRVLDEDTSDDRDVPKASDAIVVAKLKTLRGNRDDSLVVRIKQTLQYLDANPELESDFNGHMKDFLGQLKVMEQFADALMLLQTSWPLPYFGETSGCRSSVYFYVNMPRPRFGAATVPLVEAWTEYNESNQFDDTDKKLELYKMTWNETFTAIETQHREGLGEAAAAVLRDLFQYKIDNLEDSDSATTPRRKSRAQIIAMARARKNPPLLAPGKPKKDSSNQTSVRSTADSSSRRIIVTIPRQKAVASSSSTLVDAIAEPTSPHSKFNWGWADSFNATKPSQFGDDVISTSRAEPKAKTHGTPNASLAEEPAADEPEPEPDSPGAGVFIFTDPDLYAILREIFPLSSIQRSQTSLPEPTRRIKFTEVRGLLRSPPLNFREMHIGMPECRWETPTGKWFTFHTPHKKHGGWIEGYVLQNLKGQLRRAFGWTGEEFVLDEDTHRGGE